MVYQSEAINDQHDITRFDSGQVPLDTWLQQHALTSEARRTGRTFVWADRRHVVAYYTIAAHLLIREALPSRLGRGNPSQVPAILLARLALDKTRQGRGYGSALLADALARIVVATETIGARFIVVDAIDSSAHAFYRHHGFASVPNTMRLVHKISDVSAALST